jgi:MFS family permease
VTKRAVAQMPSPISIVGAMTGVQALVTMGITILPVIAPQAAVALGVKPALIGMQVSLLYGFAALTSLYSGRCVRRFGAVRTSQAALAFIAAGLFLAAAQSLWAIAAGSLLMGIAYGLPGAAASHLLTRFTDPQRRNLIFSLKQTGVPLGGVLAGLIAPSLAQAIDWRAPLLATGLAALGAALLFAPVRPRLDDDWDPGYAMMRFPIEGLRSVLAISSLRPLSGVGFLLAGVQVSIIAFLVILLVQEYQFTVVAAGAVMAAVQVAGVVGRIVWGFVADRAGDGLATMSGLAGAITLLLLSLVFIGSAQAPLAVAVLVALGGTASAWNGVFLAETARLAPAGRVGEATAVILSGTYLGVFIGPALLGAAAPAVGSYRISFALLASASAVALVLTLVARTRSRA